jgi:hypothetical protein
MAEKCLGLRGDGRIGVSGFECASWWLRLRIMRVCS